MSYNKDNPTFGEANIKEEVIAENKATFKVTVKPLTGNDTTTFNATINALRSGSFVNFLAYYEQELSSFFKGVEYEDLVDKKKFDLSIGCEKLPIQIIAKCFSEVLAKRKLELAPILVEKEVEFKELDAGEKIRLLLLYQYGDKIGGYPALAAMSINEAMRLYHYFKTFSQEKNKKLQQELEMTGG